MPKRRATYKVDSSEVQGPGSWVELRYITYGDFQSILEDGLAQDAFLTKHVVAWNWVDGDGQPLPVPQDCLQELFAHERTFLFDCLYSPNKAALKN